MKTWQLAPLVAALLVLLDPALAQSENENAGDATPGFSEKVLQWTVQKGETCSDIAKALYGHKKHRRLLQRYNRVDCNRPLSAGTTLTVPDATDALPPAKLVSTTPTVRAKAPGAAWSPASPGMSLFKRYSVNTLDNASADIRFRDRTQVYLGEQTLVIIYDTAEGSQVRRKAVDVELEQGELRAGIAALRGSDFRVATTGGGQVTTNSPDTVLRRKGKRTTVSVMSGKAEVRSRGRTVKVPAKYGTAFTKKAAPKPPRKLPPAPKWETGAPRLAIASSNQQAFSVAWQPVERATAYRVELANDPAFETPLLRQETPASVQRFEAKSLPAGEYYVRVQAIDKEDFLGLATEPHHVSLLSLERDGLTPLPAVGSDVLDLHPYEQLRFAEQGTLELSVDEQPFQQLGSPLKPGKSNAQRLRVRRTSDDAERSYRISYSPIKLKLQGTLRERTQSILVEFHGFEGLDVAKKVKPFVVLDNGIERTQLPLQFSSFTDGVPTAVAEFERDPTQPMKVEVLDGYKRILIAEDLPQVESPAEEPRPREPLLGASNSMVPADAAVSTPWWSPARVSSVSVGVNTTINKAPLDGQVIVAAQGFYGPWALRARVGFDSFNFSQLADNAAWLHAGYAPIVEGRTHYGLLLGVAVPTADRSPPTRLEALAAFGRTFDGWSYLANVALRVAVSNELDDASRLSGHAVFGARLNLLGAVDGMVWADGHYLSNQDRFRYAGNVALEVGSSVFGALALRATPFEDDLGGPLLASFTLGIRERSP